ncbi:hypothetical protein FRC0378_00162 [Corynebacterium diphtheriae]|nr:hypothetical protein FRC0378_00162 [Corynebacterium diphtheriae]
MANTVLQTPTTTKEAAEKIEQFRLVVLTDEGKIKHADGTKFPYGYVRQAAAPEVEERPWGDLSHGLPAQVAVVTSQAVVDVAIDPSETNFSKGTVFKAGAKVYAGANGTVCSDTKANGKKPVGIAERADHSGRVRVNLFHPSIFSADSSMEL